MRRVSYDGFRHLAGLPRAAGAENEALKREDRAAPSRGGAGCRWEAGMILVGHILACVAILADPIGSDGAASSGDSFGLGSST